VREESSAFLKKSPTRAAAQKTFADLGPGRFDRHGPGVSKVFCALFFKEALLCSSLETVLAQVLNVPEVSVGRTARGKRVIEAPAGAGMSVSYREEFAVLAVNRDGEIGADVEVMRDDLDFLGIARSCFAPDEVLRLEAADGRRRVEKFFALWTAKEAVLKCWGEGITGGMDSPCLPDLELGGRAVVEGLEVTVSRGVFAGRDVVTAVAAEAQPAWRACLDRGRDA
jgi:phosphopantetheine--protein transferase-like protein